MFISHFPVANPSGSPLCANRLSGQFVDAGNDFDLAAAVFADLDVDIENSFEALHPGHGPVPFRWTFIVPVGAGGSESGFLRLNEHNR